MEHAHLANLIHHTWAMSLKRAAALQTRLAAYVLLTPLSESPRYVAGIDTAERGDHIYAAIVVMDTEDWKVVEIQYADGVTAFSNHPGYMAFRHGPIILKAVEGLLRHPGLYFIAGHGVCHPRKFGMATHLGLRLDIPTIGCATERLVGHFDPPGEERGEYSVIRYSPEAPGVVLRTRPGVNAVFVSPGHRIDLLGAVAETMRCCTQYRLPEPLRRAHIEAGRLMRMKQSATAQET